MRKLLVIILLLTACATAQINNGGGGGVSTSAGVIALFTSCSGAQYLGADGACHNASGGVSGTGWTANSGNFSTAGSWNVDNSGTVTAASIGAHAVSSFYSGTQTITPLAGQDVQLNTNSLNINGNANNGDTWTDAYRRCVFNLNNAAGVLTHAFCQVFRYTGTSTAGSSTNLIASLYATTAMTNLNGATTSLQVGHFEWDQSATGTGTITEWSTGSFAVPSTITGATVTGGEGITVGDISPATVPGNCKTGIYIGGTCGGTSKVGLVVDASTPANLDNIAIFKTSAPVQIGGALEVSSDVNTISSASAHTRIQSTCNGFDCFNSWYNGSVTTECGLTSNEFTCSGGNGGINYFTADNTSGLVRLPNNRITLTGDWSCGTGGTVSSCTSAVIVGSTTVPMTFTLPLKAKSWHMTCNGWVSQSTALTANGWNILTATNGATSTNAYYSFPVNGGTAPTLASTTYTLNQGATTTTFQIGGNWTLGALVGTAKYPFQIDTEIEGASVSGTVLSWQLVAPTVADLVTIYRGTSCGLSVSKQ